MPDTDDYDRYEPYLIEILKKNGYGVVEGKEAVLAKIDELAETRPTPYSRMPLGFN